MFRIVALLSLTLSACTVSSVATKPSEKPVVILISLDGFRWDYVDLVPTPNFHRLIKGGIRAQRMIPAFPSKTFSNHYTTVTGLYPEHHGIVSNGFYDPVRGESFSYRDTADNLDTRWWGGEPIWLTAEKQGLKAASFFWPGSEAKVGGINPTYHKHYDGRVTDEARVDTVLSWLDKPDSEKPSIITSYFSVADEKGHDFGPNSAEILATISHLDSIMGRLVLGLESRNILDRVNIIITSDHGMAQTSRERLIFLEDYIDVTKFRITMETPFIGIRTSQDSIGIIYDLLKNASPHMRVLRKDQMPPEYHYSKSPRIAEVICLAEEGWSITTRSYLKRRDRYFDGGTHGYDNFLPSMGATFIAAGPAFKKNLIIPPFENVHIYELLTHILKIKPAPNDGSLDSVKTMLK